MQQFYNSFFDKTLRPHVFSLLIVTIVLITISLVVYFNVKKTQKNQAPNTISIIAEQYVIGIENLVHDGSDGKLKKPTPYIFSLISFLAISNIMGLFGFTPPTSSFSVTLTLGMVSWIGIYVIGIYYRKIKFFAKYKNPIEILGQFSPLLSISLRIFGNLMGGTIIMALIYGFTNWISSYVWAFNFIAPLVTPAFHLFFDLFSAIIQAFVFTLLTIVYWTLEIEEDHVKKK